jgi:cytoskeletal protein CcmA (bactofilin family)
MIVMFNKSKNVGKVDTIIGSGTVFEGTLKCASSIRVDGTVLGEIECEGDLTIGVDGKVQRNVRAQNIFIAGTLIGEAHANQTLHILSTGNVNGNIEMISFIIEDGGKFEGTSKMNASETNKNEKKTKLSNELENQAS